MEMHLMRELVAVGVHVEGFANMHMRLQPNDADSVCWYYAVNTGFVVVDDDLADELESAYQSLKGNMQ